MPEYAEGHSAGVGSRGLSAFSDNAPHATVTVVPGRSDLGLLTVAAAQVGPWITKNTEK